MKVIRRLHLIALASLLAACGDSDDPQPISIVLSGSLDNIPESRGDWIWGLNPNYLCQQWSIFQFDQSGWFYGSSYPWSSADVFVLEWPADPLEVIAAENFDYTADSVSAAIGDTVFFRGRNGFYGAWLIEDIVGGNATAVLSGTWYFKSGGGGDFSRGTMPAPEPISTSDCSII